MLTTLLAFFPTSPAGQSGPLTTLRRSRTGSSPPVPLCCWQLLFSSYMPITPQLSGFDPSPSAERSHLHESSENLRAFRCGFGTDTPYWKIWVRAWTPVFSSRGWLCHPLKVIAKSRWFLCILRGSIMQCWTVPLMENEGLTSHIFWIFVYIKCTVGMLLVSWKQEWLRAF